MGYYSELAIDNIYHEDDSYPSYEMQLRWRIEDLNSRLYDILHDKHGITGNYYMGSHYSKDDFADAPPEYFNSISDILTAIAVAEERLSLIELNKPGIQEQEINMNGKTIVEKKNGKSIIWNTSRIETSLQSEVKLNKVA